jgi:hypothetical protein
MPFPVAFHSPTGLKAIQGESKPMKNSLIISALIFFSIPFRTSAQGTLNLSNLQPGQEIILGQGANGPGAIPGSYAQLFLGSGGTGGTALTPVVSFFPDAGATQWLVPTDFTVPGAAPGTTATFYLVVTVAGYSPTSSSDFTSNLGGTLPSGVSLPAGDTSTLQGIVIGFPEPSTFAFGIVGGLALLLFRRRK